MSAEPRVSVIVCAYTLERQALLWRNLSALRQQTHRSDETLVVADNNDRLAELVRAQWPGVRVIRNDGPAGLSHARNAGVRAATGDVLVFLDDDAVPAMDCLERLIAPFSDPGVAGVGGKAIAVWPMGCRPRWWPAEFDWVVGCSYVGQSEVRAPIRNVMGSVMALRRTVIDEAGGFRSSVGRVGDNGAGCEETEICIRYGQLHPETVFLFEPAATVGHHVAQSRLRLSYFTNRCRAEGRSKAVLADSLGRSDALRSETAYVRSTLPRGVARSLGAFASGDRFGAVRALLIVWGALVTALAYAVESGYAAKRRNAPPYPASIPSTRGPLAESRPPTEERVRTSV